jgi:hypothetical protein
MTQSDKDGFFELPLKDDSNALFEFMIFYKEKVITHVKYFTLSNFTAVSYDIQVIIKEREDLNKVVAEIAVNQEKFEEFQMRPQPSNEVYVGDIYRSEAWDVPAKYVGNWVEIKTTVHYHTRADFLIKPGQIATYLVKLVDWQGCASPAFGVDNKPIGLQ